MNKKINKDSLENNSKPYSDELILALHKAFTEYNHKILSERIKRGIIEKRYYKGSIRKKQ